MADVYLQFFSILYIHMFLTNLFAKYWESIAIQPTENINSRYWITSASLTSYDLYIILLTLLFLWRSQSHSHLVLDFSSSASLDIPSHPTRPWPILPYHIQWYNNVAYLLDDVMYDTQWINSYVYNVYVYDVFLWTTRLSYYYIIHLSHNPSKYITHTSSQWYTAYWRHPRVWHIIA